VSKIVRARNLGDSDIAEVVAILDGWTGKLTWELLVVAIKKRLHQEYTRQALNNHARIADAFRQRKKTASKAQAAPNRRRTADASQELDAALQRIQVIEAENLRLLSENARLLEQFVRWAHNAYTRGLDKDFLSRPLPSIDRAETKVTMESISKRKR
jgi:hypothetical protein